MQRHAFALMTVTLAAVLGALPAAAGEGVMEINQAVADAGLPPCDASPGLPCTIGQPGSYKLTGNLETTSADVDVVEITAEHVTLDLNGFTISGPNVCTFSSGAVTCTSSGTGNGVTGDDLVTVRNGFVQGMGRDGVDIGDSCRVEDVVASHNGSRGLNVIDQSHVIDCSAFLNGSTGISADYQNQIRGSEAHKNGGRGISSAAGSLIDGCVSFMNEGVGLFGAASVVISNSTTRDNYGDGIELRPGAMVRNTMTYSNAGWGIRVYTFGIDPLTFACGGNTIRENDLGTTNGVPVEVSANMCEDNTTCP